GTNGDGIFRSDDAGGAWSRVGSPPVAIIYSLAIDPAAPDTLYAGTGGGGIWKSLNRGTDWSPTELDSGMVYAITIDSAGSLYAATNSGGAQVSRDGGDTWQDLDTSPRNGCNCPWAYSLVVVPSNPKKVFLSTSGDGLLMTA